MGKCLEFHTFQTLICRDLSILTMLTNNIWVYHVGMRESCGFCVNPIGGSYSILLPVFM